MARGRSTRVEIEAPAADVWAILVDLRRYPLWNPLTLRVEGALVEGGALDLLEDFGDGDLRRALAVVGRRAPGEVLRWVVGGPSWWSGREQVLRVEPLGLWRCCYVREDRWLGLLGPLLARRDGPALERAAGRMAAALKRRAEAPWDDADLPDWQPEIGREVRETFVLRGQFIPPPPPSPSPPASPDALAVLLAGYDLGVTTYQSPTRHRRVDRSEWQPCHACGAVIPVVQHWRAPASGETPRFVAAISYVCPRCHATQLGERMHCDPYDACHVCDAPLGDALACARCGMLRNWTVVACPTCSARQPVLVPHLGVRCDVFTLECVACECEFISLCIC